MLPKTVGLFLLLLHDVFVSVNCYSGSAMLKTKQKRSGENRQKRLLSLITDPALNFYFEYNSCYAVSRKHLGMGYMESSPARTKVATERSVQVSLSVEQWTSANFWKVWQ